ncbi:kinase-like protein [Microstroma glucosiphilum]|uniref:Cyclin-dependent kinase 8 n=1 Tax=Pseudomicrostroma glucosiphilum TaxID=1684307 RepID=A0A316UDE4_9BASI|nr:kinase-like protein [Pseudomicrostroma glucosiphilum]PWN23182.1 kinase-like protein [Pseudomicrostroma glucosiphilum]
MTAWREYRDHKRRTILSTYQVLGFLSSGTYGRVYKACLRHPEAPERTSRQGSQRGGSSSRVPSPNGAKNGKARENEPDAGVYAIKKFKADKEAEAPSYTGISQSAMREIALNRELRHENIVTLREVMLEDRAIYMVFSYASHDFLQLIHHHSTVLREGISPTVLKSLLFQLLSGVHYLHSNWVLHRDLKPANILLTHSGVVKIGDLGLARLYSQPLQPLYNGDKVVVTIWYRAPELLMGARHYTPAIDMWAVGCIWGELLSLRPLFKGEEAKMEGKGKPSAVLQTDQMAKIVDILGPPSKERWPSIDTMPEWRGYCAAMRFGPDDGHSSKLSNWFASRSRPPHGASLFERLLMYDPGKRVTAERALEHAWFKEEPVPTRNAFASLPLGVSIYPPRRLHSDTTDPVLNVDPSQVAPALINSGGGGLGGGTSMAFPGPAAPAPAPASGGSLPNSVGPSGYLNSVSGGVGIGHLGGIAGLGQSSSATGRGGMVATAAANAQNKRAKLG